MNVKTTMDCFNQTSSSSPSSLWSMVGIAVLVSCLIFVTMVGNILVVIAVLTSRALKAPQNLFLVSLAAADVLVAALVMPFSLANELMGYWSFGELWCGVYLALDVLFCTSSIGHLCAISLDRYWSVTQAVEYNLKRTSKRVKAVILTVWLISAVISSPPLLTIERNSEKQCKLNDDTWYILASSTASFYAPCLVMVLVYIRIYQVAKTRTRSMSEKKNNGMQSNQTATEDLESSSSGGGNQKHSTGATTYTTNASATVAHSNGAYEDTKTAYDDAKTTNDDIKVAESIATEADATANPCKSFKLCASWGKYRSSHVCKKLTQASTVNASSAGDYATASDTTAVYSNAAYDDSSSNVADGDAAHAAHNYAKATGVNTKVIDGDGAHARTDAANATRANAVAKAAHADTTKAPCVESNGANATNATYANNAYSDCTTDASAVSAIVNAKATNAYGTDAAAGGNAAANTVRADTTASTEPNIPGAAKATAVDTTPYTNTTANPDTSASYANTAHSDNITDATAIAANTTDSYTADAIATSANVTADTNAAANPRKSITLFALRRKCSRSLVHQKPTQAADTISGTVTPRKSFDFFICSLVRQKLTQAADASNDDVSATNTAFSNTTACANHTYAKDAASTDVTAVPRKSIDFFTSRRKHRSSLVRCKLTQAREKRLTFVLAVVMGVFVACWFPFFFTYSLYGVCGAPCKIPDTLFKFFFWIGYCNSALNPAIYTIFNRDFRRAFHKILCNARKTSQIAKFT
ncbi:alpha-2 adrenergic receptor-like [Dunckerocampus dactyliophorus]|uniref:alpha-2 adrenergic receptor-like n=1 Tax=Dunckerocampus dactyliophorus TaxID=161453 RepID=UPI0024075202|nr:alpha-2 adrenergic receptor-like [Dunckerocampus dactyliophorus]